MLLRKLLSRALLLGVGLASLAASASAQLNFHVNLDTSGLAVGTYYVDFSLSDGHVASLGTLGPPNTNNTVSLSNFSLGGGTAGAILPPTLGIASGNFASGFSLADGDSGGVADIAQGFTPGSSLSFDVALSTNTDVGGTPDLFLFRLLDSNSNYLSTTDPSGNDGLISASISSSTSLASIGRYGSSRLSNTSFPAPTLTAITSTVAPEPGSLPLLLGGICSSSFLVLRRRRSR